MLIRRPRQWRDGVVNVVFSLLYSVTPCFGADSLIPDFCVCCLLKVGRWARDILTRQGGGDGKEGNMLHIQD